MPSHDQSPSKDEQLKRIINRVVDGGKNWKFCAGDVEEKEFWKEYMRD